MARGGNPLLVRGFKIETSGGVGQYLAVCQGSADFGVILPGGANAAGFVGFTTDAQATQNKDVPVAVEGIVFVVADDAISAGNKLKIGGTAGKVTPVATSGATAQEVVAIALESALADGDVIEALIHREKLYPALS